MVTSESSHSVVVALDRFHCFYWMFDEYNSVSQDPQAGVSISTADGAMLHNGDAVGGDNMESDTDMQEEQHSTSERMAVDSDQVLDAF